MDHYYEMMLTDKKRIPFWSHRLHLALKAYQVDDRVIMNIAGEYREEMTETYHVFQELLNTLMTMDRSTDQDVRECSRVIKSNIFYVPEYRETILSQLLCFDETKMSR